MICIASQKACLSRKKPFLFIGNTVNQIDAPFSVDASIDLNFLHDVHVLHDVLLVTFCSFANCIVQLYLLIFDVIFLFLRLIRDYLEIEFRYALLYSS